MKAAIVREIAGAFEIADVKVDDAQGQEVRVEVRASGLCHSDINVINSGFQAEFPLLGGHEVSGVVVQVGEQVTSVEVGDHVVACLIEVCGACRNCLAGRSYQCLHPEATSRVAGAPPRLTVDGESVFQLAKIGGFAEEILVHENHLAAINKDVPFPQAALIGCGVVTGAGSAINAAQVRVGDTVAVFGTGGVGLNGISGALIAGAEKVIAVDIDDSKLAVATSFGATDVVNSRNEDPVEAVKQLSDGGVDHAFEFIGLAVTQQAAYESLGKGGTAYYIGMAGSGSELAVDTTPGPMLIGQPGTRGVYMGSTNLKRDIPLYAALYAQGRLNLDDLVSKEISLSQVGEGYEALEGGGIIRSVITSF